MRPFLAVLLAGLMLCGCSRHTPPTGKWEGTYDSGGVMIAARLQIDPNGQIFESAPNAEDSGVGPDDRAALQQRLAQGLAAEWSEVEPRQYDFSDDTFRKPGGIAPQLKWHSSDNTMTMYVYLGTDSLHVALHPVKDFSADPWAH